MSSPVDVDAGLPANIDAERFVLGSILLDGTQFGAASLAPPDFLLESHQQICRRMAELHRRNEPIDRVTVALELQKHGELASVGGLSYLISLDDGLPQRPHVDSYVQTLKDQASRRRIVYLCQELSNRCTLACEDVRDIVATGQEQLSDIASHRQTCKSVTDLPLVRDYATARIKYIREPELPAAALVALTGDSSSGKSSLATAYARDSGVPVLILDRENPISVIADRFERLNVIEGPRLRIWGGWLPEDAPLPDAPVVASWVRSCEPKPLIVVDSLSAFGVEDENDASQMRRFLHRCRHLADLGATVIVLHHVGKSETAREYRGSSDFKAAVDMAFHVSNFGDGGRLDKLVLRCFKSRFGFAGELVYRYAGGQFVRGASAEARETVNERLTAVLRVHPGISSRQFDDAVKESGIPRTPAREWLTNGVLLSGAIERRRGARNTWRYYLVADRAYED
jgi:hypothetical protein